ncbi:MAG: AMP-binding protein, partial [Gammaproteobacteria bacterium]|nr:AMP-binding protein [Gammaproteobacteria bacterium]
DNPPERLRFMLEDSKARVLLSQSHLRLPPSQAAAVDLNGEWERSAAHSGTNPVRQSRPDNLAYVIYTSGSTGKPKAVMIQQYSVVNMITAFNRIYHIDVKDKVLQQASFAFDVSVAEILSVICAGGTLVVPAKEIVSEPEKLALFIARHGITVFGATPSLLSYLSFNDLPKLRLIFS